MAFSSKFYRAVSSFLIINSTTSQNYPRSFYKRIEVKRNGDTIILPVFIAAALLCERGNSMYVHSNSLIATVKTYNPRTVNIYESINSMFTEVFTGSTLARSGVPEIVEYNVKRHKYYISRGFIADNSNVYIYTDVSYTRTIRNGEPFFEIESEHVYINSCVYSIKNDMTKFITSRLIPCMNELYSSQRPNYFNSKMNIILFNRNTFNNEGPCTKYFKISYICNSEMNKKFKEIEAPKIQSFSNEEILDNMIKYLEK